MKPKHKVEKDKFISKFANREKDWFYFSDSSATLESWTGGGYYEHLAMIELFGFKLELWKKK